MPPAFLPHPPLRAPQFLRNALKTPYRKPLRTTTMTATPPSELGVSKVLFAKAAPDGSLGDCPFTQKANLALNFHTVPFVVHTIDLGNKPQWFLDLNDAGTTPVFVDSTHAIGDSDEIVEYADKIGHGVNLIREDDPNWDAAFDAVSPIFGGLVRLLKNKDDAEEAGLRAALGDALRALDTFLGSVKGTYLLGDDVSALDCNLMPKLHHLAVAASHYKNFVITTDYTNVLAYLEAFRTTDAWKNTSCPDEVIIWGWSKFFS